MTSWKCFISVSSRPLRAYVTAIFILAPNWHLNNTDRHRSIIDQSIRPVDRSMIGRLSCWSIDDWSIRLWSASIDGYPCLFLWSESRPLIASCNIGARNSRLLCAQSGSLYRGICPFRLASVPVQPAFDCYWLADSTPQLVGNLVSTVRRKVCHPG
jgi:hypothetical protein